MRTSWRPFADLVGIAGRDANADEPAAPDERRDVDTRAFGGHAAGTWPERFDVENVEDVTP